MIVLSFFQAWRAAAFGLLLAFVCAGCVATGPESALGEIGNLGALRQAALSLVNQARSEQGVGALEPMAALNAAAQAHAEDMARRNYYGHRSPERRDVMDRYLANGGGRWRIVGENIANCGSCPTPPTSEQVRYFHRDWMQSPGHRRNILNSQFNGFGFGVAIANGRTYAVQTFLGTGP